MSNNWTVLILLVLASVAASSPLEEGLLRVITKWRDNDLGSLPFALPLPSPGHIPMDRQETEYDGYTLTLDGVVLHGLDSLTVDRLAVEESEWGLTASLAINIPKLTITAGWYQLQSRSHFGFRLVNNRGSFFQTEISNFRVTADVVFDTDDDNNTAIQTLVLDYSFGDTESYLSNSYGWLIKKFNKKVPRYLTGRKYTLLEEASTLIENKVNNALRGYSPERLKNIIRDIE